MTVYSGEVHGYSLLIYTPNLGAHYKAVIRLRGTFGEAFLYFTPPDGTLGRNRKRDGLRIFDLYYWMYSWAQFVDMLRNEKPVNFVYDDVTKAAQIVTRPWEPVGEAES